MNLCSNLIKSQFDKIEVIETRNGSEKYEYNYKVSLNVDYYPNSHKFNIPNPISYIRETENFIPYRINYFFSQSDSVVRLIDYTWDKKSFTNNLFQLQKALIDEYKAFDGYNKQYNKVFAELVSRFGQPSKYG